MFGISFSELLLVGLVALLVLGPERLPGAARTAGLWVGRLKRSFNAIKQEVEREIGADGFVGSCTTSTFCRWSRRRGRFSRRLSKRPHRFSRLSLWRSRRFMLRLQTPHLPRHRRKR